MGKGAFGDEGRIEVTVRWKPANGITTTRLKADIKKERRKVSRTDWTEGLRDDIIVLCRLGLAAEAGITGYPPRSVQFYSLHEPYTNYIVPSACRESSIGGLVNEN